jgi:hypothetical protein
MKYLIPGSVPPNIRPYRYPYTQKSGRITTPLMTLTKKDAFSWTPEANKAFEQLKEVMCKGGSFLDHSKLHKNLYCGM